MPSADPVPSRDRSPVPDQGAAESTPVIAADAAAPRTHLGSWLAALLLAAVLLYFSLRGVDWREVWRVISAARVLPLGLAALTTTVSFALRALRWRLLLSGGHQFGFLTVFSANMVGYLGNAFLPARAGEVVRSVMISRRGPLSKTYVLTTAAVERLSDAIALVLACSMALLSLPSRPAWLARASGTTAVVATAGAVALVFLPRMEALVHRTLRALPLPAKFDAHLDRLASQVLLGIRALHDAGRFWGFTAFTAAIWLCDSLSSIVLASSLGLHLSFPVAVLLLTGMGLGSALPSTPGYVGIYQFVAVTVLRPFGFSRSDALAYILVVQAIGYVLISFWGLMGLLRYRAEE